MIFTNIKTTLRDIKKNKLFSIINILGLAIGLTCSIIIFSWINYELSHDDFHVNKKNIFKVSYKNDSYNLPGPLTSYLKREFPEIEKATQYLHRSSSKLTVNNKGYFADGSFVDQSFLDIFSFPLLRGNPETLLTDPNSIVLTEQLAKKIFGSENPIGKTIQINDGYLEKTQHMTVTGILKNPPPNTHFKVDGENRFEFLIPFKRIDKWIQTNWEVNIADSYVLLTSKTKKNIVEKKIANVVKKHDPQENIELSLVPLKNVYLYNLDGSGKFQHIYIFSFIALFILIIAIINYINLSTVRSEKWAKQISIKKILGASKKTLIKQFLLESVIFTYISMGISLILTVLLLPSLNRFFETSIHIPVFSFHIIIIFTLPLLIGIIAGFYPAFVLSSTKPIKILGNNFRSNKSRRGIFFRNGLIVFQFALSVILIIFGSVIYLQSKYLENKDLGYKKENLLVVRMRGDLKKSYRIVKEKILNLPEVKFVSSSNNPITHRYWTVNYLKWDNQVEGQNVEFGVDLVDFDFEKTMGFKMLKGHFLSNKYKSNPYKGVVINEEAAKKMNLQNPIGKQIKGLLRKDYVHNIIGVMKNFHSESLHQKIKPHLYLYVGGAGSYIYISHNSEEKKISHLISKVKSIIRSVVPSDPFSYYFLDSELNKLYKDEKIIALLINFSIIITILLSCLGLIGLAFYTTREKTKEISIRKVLGGSVIEIVYYLTKKTTKLIIIANIIAWPIAWKILNSWLQNYPYKPNIGLGIFIISGIISILIAIITISYQTIKASNINPAECLRRE